MATQKDNKQSGKQDNGNQSGGGRGFASMDEDRQREIASEGGRAAHASGHAHEFDSEEAREAGRKGGQARAQSNERSSRSDDDDGGKDNQRGSGGTRGGTSEQHARAGEQSHKNR